MKFLTCLFLMMLTANAQAGLQQFGQSRDNTSYFESGTVKRSGSKVSVWTLTEYRERQKAGFLSTRSHKEIDCKNQKERTVQYMAYAENKGQGQVVGEINEPNSWQDIAPGTRNSRLLLMVCGE